MNKSLRAAARSDEDDGQAGYVYSVWRDQMENFATIPML